MELVRDLETNIANLEAELGIGVSFDMIGKRISMGGRKAYLVMIDGFAKDEVMMFITQRLQSLRAIEIGADIIQEMLNTHIAYMEVEESDDFETMQGMLLSGAVLLVIDGESRGLIIDAREYPVRSPSEPELEKVTRGPRDGFVETIVFNTALIRRRVKDPGLRFCLSSVGARSKTSVAVCYVEGLADMAYVEELKQKINKIEVDSLVMAEKSLSELLVPTKWYNPLPQTRYTERPDAAAAHLMEGHVLILVDTTPSVIILPTTIFHFTQHSEDYYQTPLTGTYVRWVRFVAMAIALLLIPIWLCLVEEKQYLPQFLRFIGPKENGNIPLAVQFLMLDFGLDLLKISSIHTPNSLTTSLGIIGGLILSEMAVKVGWCIPETVLYTAIAGICTFTTPSIEFAMAIRLFRLLLVVATGIFGLKGFVVGLGIIILISGTTRNSSKKSYFWPLIPFNAKALMHIVIRQPVPQTRK